MNAARAVEKALATIGTKDTVAPTAPTNLTSSNTLSTSTTLSWGASSDDNTGVSGYNIFRNGTKVGTTTSLSYTDSGLSPQTSYTYTVRAFDGAGNTSAESNTVSVTTPDVALTVTTSVQGRSVSRSTASVSWTTNLPARATLTYGTNANNLSQTMNGATTE